MFNLFDGLKDFVIGVVASAGIAVNPIAPVSVAPAPQILNEDSYVTVQGQYTFLFQTLNYSVQVPLKGGSFVGNVEGFCQAQVSGEYEGENGGKVNGQALGNCNFLGIKYGGSTGFRGKLYPDSKIVEIEVDNSPVKGPVKVNYN